MSGRVRCIAPPPPPPCDECPNKLCTSSQGSDAARIRSGRPRRFASRKHPMSIPVRHLGVLFVLGLVLVPPTFADDKPDPAFASLKYRLVGPFRGGRSCTVTGVPGKPMLYYFGSTGGGVWRTTDGGASWECISDGFFGGSIGAVAVSESDPNVIFVGEGEKTVRGNVSSGIKGVWRSTDAGKTWKNVG